MSLSADFWDEYYESNDTQWDVGYPTTPLKEYFDQLTDKSLRILIPGAGRAWEAEYLYNLGFKNTFILDFSVLAIAEFEKRCYDFPGNQIINCNYFEHDSEYDLIVEQTFFSSLRPSQRQEYALSTHNKLSPKGKLVGLLFNHEFPFDKPPYGGSEKEYFELFNPLFELKIFETAYNSIMPRKGRELFLLLQKKNG